MLEVSTLDNNKKLENLKSIDEIIYPEIEPGIISKQMIERAYLESGYKGEAARLHQMEPVVYDRIYELRLEFKNILRIGHLWILPNLTKLSLNCNKIEVIEHIEMLTELKELDLSFNYIEKIEGLEKLVKLEVLTLFNNLITKIENLQTLENLVILSIGNNNIDSVEGIERFRFFKKLAVLNLEGNPIAQNAEFPLTQYVAAILPGLKYYEYVAIKEEARIKARERFYREIREIEANEEKELIDRALKEKEERDAERLALSFVEHLNEHQLFQSLWKHDEDGRVLMMIGQPAEDLAEEYDKDMYEVTQEIYKLGLIKYEEREVEINDFHRSLEEGQKDVQEMGQKIIEDFLQYKEEVFILTTDCLKSIESRVMRGEDEESPENIEDNEKYEKYSNEYDDNINIVWQQLMSQELHLHEAIEEATINFQRKIQEMMSKFIEQAQTFFGQLRDIALHFSENLTEVVQLYISQKMALHDFADVPEELMVCMEDRDAVINFIAGMKDVQTSTIDEREDRLMVRSRQFIENMIDKLNTDELQRNRSKILEINTFLEIMSEQFGALQNDVHEQMLNEEG